MHLRQMCQKLLFGLTLGSPSATPPPTPLLCSPLPLPTARLHSPPFILPPLPSPPLPSCRHSLFPPALPPSVPPSPSLIRPMAFMMQLVQHTYECSKARKSTGQANEEVKANRKVRGDMMTLLTAIAMAMVFDMTCYRTGVASTTSSICSSLRCPTAPYSKGCSIS